jgi:RNA polymerase sigma factor (sigma-70 family)
MGAGDTGAGDTGERRTAAGQQRPIARDLVAQRDALADELLAVRCLLGEPEAFDALVAHWHEPLWRYLRSLLPDEHVAADALQDTWLRVLRSMPRLREPARLRPWLFGIARRTAMDRLRERYAQPLDDSADVPEIVDPSATADAALLAELDAQDRSATTAQLLAGLDRMPVIDRDVLVLFYLQDLSIAQVADVQDVPIGTVKSRLSRARTTLRRLMSHQESHR